MKQRRTPVQSVAAQRVPSGETVDDWVIVEEPLEIRLAFGPPDARTEERVSVTMRTPGADALLAVGFLFNEGIINSYTDVKRVEYCRAVKPDEYQNVIRVELEPDFDVDLDALRRNFFVNSSCGICGKTSIEAVLVSSEPVTKPERRHTAEDLIALPEKMRKAQVLFNETGACHAAGLFDASLELLFVHEDVGRHNAVDKVVGQLLEAGVDPAETTLALSGRAGFELVQKAAVAQIPTVVAVGAPSSLAIELAQKSGIGIYGFARNGTANKYS